MDASTDAYQPSSSTPTPPQGMPSGSVITAAASAIVLPLALGQFICSFSGSAMNVAINNIARDLSTTVTGVQSAITMFTLTMAALMIPGSKVTDIWGRKFCFILGLIVYGLGGITAALAPSLGVMIFGYSLLEGIGSALLIPPVYILITVSFADLPARARSFGIVSGAAGIGAATGPLIGGVVTTAISWRATFLLEVLVVATIAVLSRRIPDAGIQGAKPRFDLLGAILSAAGLFFLVFGVLQTNSYGWLRAKQDVVIGTTVIIPQGGISPLWILAAIGALFLLAFFLHIRSVEHEGGEPLLATRMFRNRAANLGLVTQNIQWLMIQGTFFVVSVFLQTVRGYNAIQTGLILTPATIGTLLTSALAGRMAKRRLQKRLIVAGFMITIVGIALLILLGSETSNILSLVPGLLLIGMGVGIMLTSSVNVVQSAFPDKDQGEISGLSRSVSNLGSSFGTAIAGSVIVSNVLEGNKDFGLALIVLLGFACVGLLAALFIPRGRRPVPAAAASEPRPAPAT
jgi:MFS family permease